MLIPGRQFTMGAFTTFTTGDSAWTIDSMPQHPVTVPSFFLSKYELTLGQWVALAPSESRRDSATPTSCPFNQLASEFQGTRSCRSPIAVRSRVGIQCTGWWQWSPVFRSGLVRVVQSQQYGDSAGWQLFDKPLWAIRYARKCVGVVSRYAARRLHWTPERRERVGGRKFRRAFYSWRLLHRNAHDAMAATRAFFASTSAKKDVGLRPPSPSNPSGAGVDQPPCGEVGAGEIEPSTRGFLHFGYRS